MPNLPASMSFMSRMELCSALEAIKRSASACKLLEEDLYALSPEGGGFLRIVAIGKAAYGMTQAALKVLGGRVESVLCIGPKGSNQFLDERVTCLQGEHPIPGQGSFRAGQTAQDWARRARNDGASVMVLLSGGASSLCEWPAFGVSQHELANLHRECVSSGEPIEDINQKRGQYSALKAGGLAELLGPSLIDVRVLVDVPSGDLTVVGSGPCTSEHYAGPMRAIGTPADLVDLAAKEFVSLNVTRAAPRAWSLNALSQEMERHIETGTGAWITGGEVQVSLPTEFLGQRDGGRAQHLALEVANRLHHEGPWAILAWASDGRDGHSGSGALITSDDREKLEIGAVTDALATYTSGSYLESIGCRLNSFASETNLTDLYMVLRP